MDKYKILGKIGEGTFSTVWKCQVVDSASSMCGQQCSVKRMKKQYPSIEHVNSLREVQALKRLNPHPNILQLFEVVYTPADQTLDLVCELLTENLYEKIKDRKQPLPTAQVKSYIYQLCKALEHMHRNGIFHRDVKPENILIDNDTDTLKLADFGSCRGIHSKMPFTEYISTRWYRAPECLLTDGYYGFKMDLWSVGCVFYELATLRPLFPGANEVDQLAKIHGILGVPDKAVLDKIRRQSMHMSFRFPETAGCGLAKCAPHASAHFLDVLGGLLEYDPDERMSARQALSHAYFADSRKADVTARRAQKAGHRVAAGPGHNDTHNDVESGPSAAVVPRKPVRNKGPRLGRELRAAAVAHRQIHNDDENGADAPSNVAMGGPAVLAAGARAHRLPMKRLKPGITGLATQSDSHVDSAATNEGGSGGLEQGGADGGEERLEPAHKPAPIHWSRRGPQHRNPARNPLLHPTDTSSHQHSAYNPPSRLPVKPPDRNMSRVVRLPKNRGPSNRLYPQNQDRGGADRRCNDAVPRQLNATFPHTHLYVSPYASDGKTGLTSKPKGPVLPPLVLKQVMPQPHKTYHMRKGPERR